jgi:hypothetical protein
MDLLVSAVSLQDTPTEPTPISLDSEGQQATPLSSSVVDSRARKAEFGLGPVIGATKDDAATSIGSGQEMGFRRSAALEIDKQKSDAKLKTLQGMAGMQGGSVSQDQLQFLNDKNKLADFIGTPAPTDPGSVLEEYYSGQYLKPMWDISDQFNKGSFMPEAMKQIPQQVTQVKQASESLTAAREIINTRLENSRQALADQAWLGRAADFGKELVPGYSESALKGGWSQIFQGGLRGSALRQQARELWALPPDQLKKTFNERMDALEAKDPALAVEYGEHMLGFSTSEEHLQNFFTTLDIASIPAAGIGKAVTKGIRVGAAVTGVTEALAKKAELYNATTQAAKDAVKSTEGEGIPLRTLVNQHFGQESARLDFEKKQLSKEFKRVATTEVGLGTPYRRLGEIVRYNKPEFPNEGARSQVLDSIVRKMNDIEKQKTALKDWHASYLVDGPDETVRVNQVSGDPAVTSAVGRGDLKTAGIEKLAKQADEQIKGIGDNLPKNNIEALTDNLRGDIVKENADPGHGGQEFVNRNMEQGDRFIQRLQNAAKNIMRAQRLPGLLANKEALKAIAEYTKNLYPGIRNSILNISDPIFHPEFNTYTQKMFLGRNTAEYFQSRAEAADFAQQQGLTATIQQKGLGWYLEVEKPLDETMHPIRDWLVKTKESQAPGGWLNAAVGWLRTPEDTLSLEQNMQRKLVTYNTAPFMAFAKEAISSIRELGGIKNAKDWWGQWKDWERAVAYSRDAPVPGSETGEKGYFFTPTELDDFWQRNFDNKLPTVAQKAAYFQFKRIVEYDRVLRSMAVYRNKTRLGVESHIIKVQDKDGNILTSNSFDGKALRELPGGVHNVLIADRTGRNVFPANAIAPKMRNELIESINKGELRVIELYSPGERPFEGFAGTGDQRIRYVVVRNSEASPLDITKQIPRKGGGHFEYDYEHYIKQANMRYDTSSGIHYYEGDTTLMPVGLRAMGRDIVSKLNPVRELIQANKIEEARTLAERTIPAIPWDEHLGWYLPTKDATGKVVPPRLNKEEALQVVPRDSMISDVDNSLKGRYENRDKGFEDSTRQGALDKIGQVQYTGQRDVYDMKTLKDTGTRHNPIYTYEPAQFVDPITTLNRSTSRIVNSTLMDDYKIYSVESWIQEAKNWLDVGNRDLSDIERSPFHYFNHPVWKTGAQKEAPDIIRRLEDSRMKINQLVGMPNKIDTFLHSAQQALADGIYNKLGPRAVELTPNWLLPKLRDPTRFLRSIVFNEKMGLFSVPQFLVHAMTYANVLGIAGPKNGTVGAMGAILHGWAAVNKTPEILEALDKIGSQIGMKPGFFKEANETLSRTGFMDVHGEHAFLDAPMANKLIQNKGATFLDAGQIFFRGGVKSLRAGSWYTAFKEFRDLHPVGAITDDDLKSILYRADLLSHNMSRASASTLTRGVMAIPAQFYTYQLRLAELMFGKRLTGLEKMRLLGVNSVIFGVPVGLGLSGTTIFGDNLKSYAQENGYQIGDSFINDMMMNGLPAAIEQMTTGHTHNIGERFGAKGAEPVTEALEGDKSFIQIFGGASLNVLANTVEQSNGLMHLVMSGIRGDGEALGQATPEDFMGPLKEITSVNSVFGIIAAVRFGNYLSKNNANIRPNSPMNAVVKAITGLSEQQDTDLWTKSQDLKANQAYERKLQSMFTNRFNLGMQEMNIKNDTQGQAYFKEAFNILHMGGYPEDKIPEVVASALEANKDNMVNRNNYNYFLKVLLPKQLGK